MTTTPAMPELPKPHIGLPWRHNAPDGSVHSSAYTADQMRAYALAALQAKPAEVSDEPTEAQIAAGMRELFAGPKPWPYWETTLKRVYQAMSAMRPQAVPMTEDTELLEFMFQHRAVVSCELEGGWDAEMMDASGTLISAASGATPRDALRRLKAHHGITAQGAQGGEG